MHRWHLDHKKPLALNIAADARLAPTNYTDDQSWQLQLGQADNAALTFQTQYGGRVGLASLVPMWQVDNRVIYQAHAYHTPPVITALAPGYLRVEAAILPGLALIGHYWVASSQAVTGQFVLHNTDDQPLTVRFDLYAHAVNRSRELQIAILTLASEENALYFGKLGNVDPVAIVAGGTVGTDASGRVAPKTGRDLTLGAGEQARLRWACAALPEMPNSVRRARWWLSQDIDSLLQQVSHASAALPYVATGQLNQDATLAFAGMQALQAFLSPTDTLPHASFVTGRDPLNGYSATGDGTDHPRAWSGQTPMVAYLLTAAVAPIHPTFAEGIIHNYLHVQTPDGSIDGGPGLAGQRQGQLIMPILARMTWHIYEITQNTDFIKTVFPGLLRFFQRWFREDTDHDADGLPEWQALSQTGYPGWPLFTRGGVDIKLVEGPGMLAYLLSEAEHLLQMAHVIGNDDAAGQLQTRLDELRATLADMWDGNAFAYRDRDTHVTPSPTVILEKSPADVEHLPALLLGAPARVVIVATGGTSHKPQFQVTVQGTDADGNPVTETLPRDAFTWTYGRGAATTNTVFTQVDRIHASGLSRVFRLEASTTGLVTANINTILPLITASLSDGQTAQLVRRLTDTLLRPNGVALFPLSDAPSADESGIWVFWNTLLCEALFRRGYAELAVDILRRMLRVQTATLREYGIFTTFYDEDDMRGMGTRLDLNGMPPLHLLMTAFGLIIHPDHSVTVAAGFPWGTAVTLHQHGLQITRDHQQTIVIYPDDTQQTVPAGQHRELPAPATPATLPPQLDLPNKPDLIPAEPVSRPIPIAVQVENDAPPANEP